MPVCLPGCGFVSGLVCLPACGLLRRNGARTPARASASRTPPFGRRGIPREMADSRVLATARHIHICLRVAVLRDSSHFRGFRPAGGGEASRAWHPREFGAVLGGSASHTSSDRLRRLGLRPRVIPRSLHRRSRRLHGDTRRYASSANTPPRLATCLAAHPTNRVAACRSVRHSPPRPLPHLLYGAFFFEASALADVSSARLTSHERDYAYKQR